MFPPRRIVCLTEETVETLYLLGEDARIAGVSGYAARPPQVRKEKPRVAKPRPSELEQVEASIQARELELAELERKLADDWGNAEVLEAHKAAREDLTELLERWESLFEAAQL